MLSKGSAYETRAHKYLKQQGLRSISRNYRSKFGEIDLIMKDRATVVFVEVKYRQRRLYGSPAETVTIAKQKKICKTAKLFLTQHQLWNAPCRFDVIAISPQENSQVDAITWYKAAFEALD